MKRIVLLIVVVFVAFVGWRIIESISSDALGLAIGVVFGVLAGLPTALLVLASNRRRESKKANDRRQQPNGQMGYGHQAPVIVLARRACSRSRRLRTRMQRQGQGAPQQAWPQQRERRFQFIGGEQDGGFDG